MNTDHSFGIPSGFPITLCASTAGFSSKPDRDEDLPRMQFVRVTCENAYELARLFRDGRSCCNMMQPRVFKEGIMQARDRLNANWCGSSVVVLDCDNNTTGLTLEQIIERLPHRPHVAYRTFSCDPYVDNKFRLVYAFEMITDDLVHRGVWTALDREFGSVTGLVYHTYKSDGRSVATDYSLRTPAQIFHGARRNSVIIVSERPVYRSEEFFKPEEFFQSDFLTVMESLPPSPSTIKISKNHFEKISLKSWTYNRNYRIDDLERKLTFDNIRELWKSQNPGNFVKACLSMFPNWNRLIIYHTPVGLCEPVRKNVWKVTDPENFFEMPTWYKDGRRCKVPDGRRRKLRLLHDGVRFRYIAAQAGVDLPWTNLMVNLLYRMDAYYEWYTKGRPADCITPEDLLRISQQAMSVDLNSVDPGILFSRSDRKYITNAWDEAEEVYGREAVRITPEYWKLDEDERWEWKRERERIVMRCRNRLTGAARTADTDALIAAVYEPGMTLAWNVRNIKLNHPGVPCSRSRIKKWCADYGIECLSEPRGGARPGCGRKPRDL